MLRIEKTHLHDILCVRATECGSFFFYERLLGMKPALIRVAVRL